MVGRFLQDAPLVEGINVTDDGLLFGIGLWWVSLIVASVLAFLIIVCICGCGVWHKRKYVGRARRASRQASVSEFPTAAQQKKGKTVVAVEAPEEEQEMKYDVFLTHDWGYNNVNHDRVAQVNRMLVERGYTTWFDDEQMTGNVAEQMTTGIDQSEMILVFITARYVDKVAGPNNNDNCKLEFNYAKARKSASRMVAVVMEDSMKNPNEWRGNVGMVLGGSLYVDMSGPDEPSPATISYLIEQLERMKEKAGAARDRRGPLHPQRLVNTSKAQGPSAGTTAFATSVAAGLTWVSQAASRAATAAQEAAEEASRAAQQVYDETQRIYLEQTQGAASAGTARV